MSGYEVLVDGLTVHTTVSKLPQPDGSTVYQNGMGRVYLAGEVVPEDQVAEDWKEALESGEGGLAEALKEKLRPSSDDSKENVARRLGLPFEGYDDMDDKDIMAALRVLPSATIQRVKQYESMRDEPRSAIVDYNIGFGEHPDDRQTAELEVPESDENKEVRKLTTRDVPEEGEVVHGEGVTGTGEPQRPYGSEKGEEVEPSGIEGEEGSAPANVAAARKRSGRRERKEQQQPPSGPTGPPAGGTE